MDPYLEDPEIWPDLHISLITYMRDALQPDLQPRYRARMDQRLYVVRSNRNRDRDPDITIMRDALPSYAVAHDEVAEYAPAGVAEPRRLNGIASRISRSSILRAARSSRR
jgi:hypothetical protein